MGFVDKKTRIIDFQLTGRGRELLAQNNLTIAHYAFSDDLIDYSGSLSQSIAQSASLDDIVYKNYIGVEADSMQTSTGFRDLQSFLYTCPEQRQALPPFTTNVSGALSVARNFQNYSHNDFIAQYLTPTTVKVNDFYLVVITEQDNTSADDREDQYAAEQTIQHLVQTDNGYITLIKS